MATSRVCSIPDCGKPHKAFGLCTMHWERMRRHGSTAKPTRKPLPSPLRDFLEAIGPSPSNECILWPGTLDRDGYGHVNFGGRRVGAHRASYTMWNGQPTGPVIRHTCDTPSCVNHRHLITGTQLDNIADRHNQGRSATGEKMPHAKLTPESAAKVFLSTLGKRETAAAFGVSIAVVHRIWARKKWCRATALLQRPGSPLLTPPLNDLANHHNHEAAEHLHDERV